MAMEKESSRLGFHTKSSAKPSTWPRRLALLLATLSLLVILSQQFFPSLCLRANPWSRWGQRLDREENWCPLPDAVAPQGDGLKPSDQFVNAAHFNRQVKRLSAAVKVPTESYDDNGEVDEDPRWKIFEDFHRVLEELFPLLHSSLELRKVNKYGLLFTWRGSVSSLKPLLFMAHQDVVPADASSNWTYPPYAGHFDGSFLWGRGSADCKSVLVGVLSVIEDLLAQSFAPRRTIVLSFGFDEETGDQRGARLLSQALVEEWGPDGILLALDEGGMGVQKLPGDESVLYAYPGVGEKGYHDIGLTLNVEGGHSSRPPAHTGIGIMADVIRALEDEPYRPSLPQSSPFRRSLECRAKYSPKLVQPWLRSALLNDGEDEIAQRLSKEVGEEIWLMQTSQAVDIIAGGIKVNALPETVQLVVNHRIAPHESIPFVYQHVSGVLAPVLERYQLEPKGLFGSGNASCAEHSSTVTKGSLELKAIKTLNPAPTSPTDNNVWAVFSGTLRSVFEDTESGRGKTVVPVGNTMTGNTDTVHYWELTRNIYRYTPSRDDTRFNTHAIDERMQLTAHLEGMRVYYDLIRNFDKWNQE